MSKKKNKFPYSEELLFYKQFEDLVFKCTNESIQKAKECLPKIDKTFAQHLVLKVATTRFFSYKLLGDFFKELGPLNFEISGEEYFPIYLFHRGILKLENFNFDPDEDLPDYPKTTEEYENPLKKEKMWWYIQHDDIVNLAQYIARTRIDIHDQHIVLFEQYMVPLELAFYCGSVNVMKFLIVNDCDVNNVTLQWAIQGGRSNVIDFLKPFDVPLCYQIWGATEYHHNELAKWLMKNYDYEDVDIPSCIDFFNTEMALYFLEEKNHSIDEREEYTEDTPLMKCAKFNYVPFAKHLLQLGANPLLKNSSNEQAYLFAESKELKGMLKGLYRAFFF